MSSSKPIRKSAQRSHNRRSKQVSLWRQPAFWIVLGVGVLAVALVVAGNGGQGEGSLDFAATTAMGENIHLSDYRGDVVMLNFWATWCPPCRAEMPTIQAAYAQRQAEGFSVLAVNNGEPLSLVQPFVMQLGLAFPVVMDTDARLQRTFAIQSYPTSIFIDATGEVYATHSGMVTAEQLSAYIDQGLARSAS